MTRGPFSNRSTLEFFPLFVAIAIAAAIAVFQSVIGQRMQDLARKRIATTRSSSWRTRFYRT